MADRFDAVTPRTGKDGKTRWIRIGAGFPKGDRIHVVLDALPLPDAEGRVMVMLSPFVPKEGGQAPAQQQGGGFEDFKDDIPF